MASPYTSTSVSGYNANPPPDDGTQVSTNLVTWASTKTKLGDPLNTFASSVNTNIVNAFAKTIDGSSVVSTATSYAAGAADQGKLIEATASGITITTPDAGTVGTPFLFAVNNQSSGTITLAGNATNSQTVDGSTTLTVQAGGSFLVKTDGTNWFTVGFKPGTVALGGNNYGFGPAVNANISCSVGSSLLTVALKNKAGNDPSASDPVLVAFRDTTLANGDPVWVTISSALSINTNATGATLASQNGKPFRFWILLFNNAGTAVLALWHSGAGAANPTINPLNEGTLQSTTGISSAATSAGVFYTPNGTSLTSKAFRVLGYLEYTSGLTTAGTYAAAPDIVQLFGPGIKKPGETVQNAIPNLSSVTQVNIAGTLTATNIAGSITPTSTANLVRYEYQTDAENPAASADTLSYQMYRGSTAIGPLIHINIPAVSNDYGQSIFGYGIDNPQVSSSTTYTLKATEVTGSGTVAIPFATSTAAYMSLTEIMA